MGLDGVRVISDGVFPLDGGGSFGIVPRSVWSRFVKPDDANCIPTGLNCLLVRVEDGYALLDAGLGSVLPDDKRYDIPVEGPRLPEQLAAAKVDPGEVRWVVLSHLHFDHAGWIARRDGDRIVPTFPNARHVVQRRELEDAADPPVRMATSYVPNQWRTISDAGLWHVVDGDAELCGGLRVIHTGGHCAGHQIVLVERDGARIVFWADLCASWLHLRPAWTTAYDSFPDEVVRLKLEWIDRVIAEDWIVASYHDPLHALARLVRAGKGKVAVLPLDKD